jgi:hypothetical protein
VIARTLGQKPCIALDELRRLKFNHDK